MKGGAAATPQALGLWSGEANKKAWSLLGGMLGLALCPREEIITGHWDQEAGTGSCQPDATLAINTEQMLGLMALSAKHLCLGLHD